MRRIEWRHQQHLHWPSLKRRSTGSYSPSGLLAYHTSAEVAATDQGTAVLSSIGYNGHWQLQRTKNRRTCGQIHTDIQPPTCLRFWNFNCLGLSRKVLCLVSELAVKLRQCPKEPVQIPNYYFRKSFALVSAEWHCGPTHHFDASLVQTRSRSPQGTTQNKLPDQSVFSRYCRRSKCRA